jgi:hypothetical protein
MKTQLHLLHLIHAAPKVEPCLAEWLISCPNPEVGRYYSDVATHYRPSPPRKRCPIWMMRNAAAHAHDECADLCFITESQTVIWPPHRSQPIMKNKKNEQHI